MNPTQFLLGEIERLSRLEKAATKPGWSLGIEQPYVEHGYGDPKAWKGAGPWATRRQAVCDGMLIFETRNTLPGLLTAMKALVEGGARGIENERYGHENADRIDDIMEKALTEAAKALGYQTDAEYDIEMYREHAPAEWPKLPEGKGEKT